MTDRVKCPAGETKNPVTSPNPFDVRCRIVGHLQPGPGAICCDGYERCAIWRAEQDRVRFFKNGANVARTRKTTRADELVGPAL